jgi:hypothetical protein
MQLYVDGACNDQSNKRGWASVCDQNEKDMLAEYRFLFTDLKLVEVDVPKGHKCVIESHFNDVAIQQNNGAELIAMICGLRIAKYLSQQCKQPNITDVTQSIDLLKQRLPSSSSSSSGNWQRPTGPPPPVIPKEGINFLARGPPQVNINSPMQQQMVQNGMANSAFNDDAIANAMLQFQQQKQQPQLQIQQQQPQQQQPQQQMQMQIPQYAQANLPSSSTGVISSTAAFQDDAIATAMAELNMRDKPQSQPIYQPGPQQYQQVPQLLNYQAPIQPPVQRQYQQVPQYQQQQVPQYQQQQVPQQNNPNVAAFQDDAIAAAMAEMQNRSAPLMQSQQHQQQVSQYQAPQQQQQQQQQIPITNNACGLVATLIYTDSDLIYQYWSKGHVSQKTKDAMDPEKLSKIYECAALLKEFNSKGGRIEKISGDNNLSDLGFHKPKATGWGNKGGNNWNNGGGYQKKSYGNNGYGNNQQQGYQKQQGQQNYQQYQQSGYSQNGQGQPIIVMSNPYGGQQGGNMSSPFVNQQSPQQQYQATHQQYQATPQQNNVQPQFNILPQ